MFERLSEQEVKSLTICAYDILVADLERTGNVLSDNHKDALTALIEEMSGYATGRVVGRRAFSLGTGCGKTSAIIAWITALYRQGHHCVAVSVSASKVEALCDLKRDLIGHGVPEHLIGIKHSHRDATLPSTGNDDRLYQLVTHARVRGGHDNPLFVEHNRQQRALMIYDESLLRSDAEAISERTLRKQVAALKEHVKGRPEAASYLNLFSFLDGAILVITRELARCKQQNGSAPVITVNRFQEVTLDGFRSLVGNSHQWESIYRFLDVVGSPLRLLQTKQDEGLVWYQICVPKELANILILDASYPIRKLVQLDATIIDSTPEAARTVKRFDNVVVHQMQHPSGRKSMTENFGYPWISNRTVSREIVDVVKGVPRSKAILIFTFKARPHEVDIPGTIMRDLSNAGIDIKATTKDGKARINILTWGDETSLNQYAHCEVVILAGLLHLPYLDMASKIVGQQDCLEASASHQQVEQILDSEIAHSVYQAISRGSCRVVENGQAKPMEVYMFHKRSSLQSTLQWIMPGLVWTNWIPTCMGEGTSLGQTDIQAMQIKEYLDRQPEERARVPTKEIRQALLIDSSIDKYRKAFDRAADKVCNSGFWIRHGQSLMRVGLMFGT